MKLIKIVASLIVVVTLFNSCSPNDKELIKEYEDTKKWFYINSNSLDSVNKLLIQKFGENIVNYEGKFNENYQDSVYNKDKYYDLFIKSTMFFELKEFAYKNINKTYKELPTEYKKHHSKF